MPKGTRPTSGPQVGQRPQTSRFYGLDFGSLASSALDFGKSFLGFGGDNSDESRHRIRKIVRDAQESGVHPLYALGAGGGYTPGFSASDGGGIRGGVEALSRAYRGYTAEQQAKAAAGLDERIANAQIRAALASAERDETQAQLNLSESARITSGLHGQGRDNSTVTNDPVLGTFTTPPAEVLSARPSDKGLMAGPSQPGMVEIDVGKGKMRIPNQQLVETPESVGLMMMLKDYWDRNVAPSMPKMSSQASREAKARARQRWVDGQLSRLRSWWFRGGGRSTK